MEWVTDYVSVFEIILTVLISFFAWLYRKSEKRQEKRAAIRAEESRLSMALMSANAACTSATAIAVRDGETNGKMEDALSEVKKAQSDYFRFINDVAAGKMSGE